MPEPPGTMAPRSARRLRADLSPRFLDRSTACTRTPTTPAPAVASSSRPGVAGLAAAGFVGPARADETPKNDSGIPLRPFGRHSDEQVTMIALGGHHVGRAQDEKDDLALIQNAVGEGITFLDNAWTTTTAAPRNGWARPWSRASSATKSS